MANTDNVLDYREPEWVAEKLGLDKNTVYRYLQEGALPGVQLGRKWLVSERLLAEHLERETRRQTQMRGGAQPSGKIPKTPRLQRAMRRSKELAQREGAGAVGTEHALIAIAEVADGMGAIVLKHLGITPDRLREMQGAREVPRPVGQPYPEPTVSDAARQAYEFAKEQAIGFGHNYMGGEHLLLGILLEETGKGGQMLKTLGVTYDVVRAELLKLIQGNE
jgi:ATP-dependent Clp protease ATP-binding subunit ClpC